MAQDHLVVTRDIPFGDPGRGVFAYRKGDRVSKDAVEQNNWQEYVAGPQSQAGQAALESAAEPAKER